MSLSLEKLHRILLEKGFAPHNHFHYHGSCRYIEIVSSEYAEHFLLTIPSQYDISCDTGFKLKNIPIDNTGRIPEKYAKIPDNIEISKLYDEIDLVRNNSLENVDDIESRLLEGYRKNIPLHTSVDGITNALKDNFNQLKRLGNCVSNLQYRVAIFDKIWLVLLNRRDEVECYYIKDYTPETNKRFIITIDLESFLQNFSTVTSDIEQINDGISRILDKNISTHAGQLFAITQNIPALPEIIQLVQAKRGRYIGLLANLSTLLETTRNREKDLKSQIESLALSKNEGNIYCDMDKARVKATIERDLSKILSTRQEILGNILKIKEKERNLVLLTDKILFDNVVMLNTINQNLETLHNLCQ